MFLDPTWLCARVEAGQFADVLLELRDMGILEGIEASLLLKALILASGHDDSAMFEF